MKSQNISQKPTLEAVQQIDDILDIKQLRAKMSQSMVHSKKVENKMKERDAQFFNPKAPKKDS